MTQETKIAKILTRTGLKASLPQPLSPGEFGTALDTGEVFIGLNPTNTSANNALPIINCYASVVDAQTYANQLISTYLFQVNLTNSSITNSDIEAANDDNVTAGFTRRYVKVASRLYISYEYKYTSSVLDIPVLPATGLGTETLLATATGISFVNNSLDLSLLGTYTWQDTSAIASLMNFAFTPSSGIKTGLVNVEQNLRLLTESDLVSMQTENVPIISVNGIKNLQPLVNTVQYVTGFYVDSASGAGQFRWDLTTSKSTHNGGTIIAPEAIAAWDGTISDVATLLNWTGTGNGCFIRIDVMQSNVNMYGAINGEIGYPPTSINFAIRKASQALKYTRYSITSPIEYRSERNIAGTHYSYGGTIITPTGNFPAFTGSADQPARTRVSISNLLIEGNALTDTYAIELDNVFLFEIDKVWIRTINNAVSITNSDSVTFRDFKAMETCRQIAVLIGDNSRSIRFYSSNFETSSTYQFTGASFTVNGNGNVLSHAELYGCQFERSLLDVIKGTVRAYGGKVTDARVVLHPHSRDCTADFIYYGSTEVYDVGFNNEIHRAYCRNMAVDKHYWPDDYKSYLSTNSMQAFGEANTEYLFRASVMSKGAAAVVSQSITIEDESGNVVTEKLGIEFPAANTTSAGLSAKQTYTHFFPLSLETRVRAKVSSDIGFVSTTIRPNRILNGLFKTDTSNWITNSCTLSHSASGVTITPSDATYGMYQGLDNRLVEGKQYIAIAKFSGNVRLTIGASWDGSNGARALSSTGIAGLFGDSDTVAMCVFKYQRSLLGNVVSVGNVLGTDTSIVRYVMVVDVDDLPITLMGSRVSTVGTINVSTSSYVNVFVQGAALGDLCRVSCNINLNGIIATAHVTVANNVQIVLSNLTNTSKTLTEATYFVEVTRKEFFSDGDMTT